MGVWKAAIANAMELAQMEVRTEIWYPALTDAAIPPEVTGLALKEFSISGLEQQIVDRQLDKQKDIIVTHGCWRFPSKWGSHLRKKGFKWIYTPQGMLEPAAMQKKRLKKKIYFSLFEKKMAANASAIRAVSGPEQHNLQNLFPASQLVLIPNGVTCDAVFKRYQTSSTLNFVFMARLHAKKGLIHLVNAWLQSSLLNNPGYRLLIAGPDDGELALIKPLIADAGNIDYVGMVSGVAKQDLLETADYFVLPSYSEGLPTALLEAMAKGAVPVITKECNLTEVFNLQLGYEIKPAADNIKKTLELLAQKGNDKALHDKQACCYQFIKDNYTLGKVAALQYRLYQSLLNAVPAAVTI